MRWLIAALMLLVAGNATAATVDWHKPTWMALYYSDQQPDTSASPWLQLQVSIKMPLAGLLGDEMEQLAIPYFPDGIPTLAFTIHAWWRIADDSSPFDELDWNPEAFYQAFGNEIPVVYGVNVSNVRVGWEHVSTGVAGMDSRGWDRVVAESRLRWHAVYLYPRLWRVFNYDQFTESISSVVNFKDGGAYGGELIGKIETEDFTFAGTFGLSWQDYEVVLPFRDLWNIAAYAYLHNGQNPSLVRYDQDETSGGVGIVLKEK